MSVAISAIYLREEGSRFDHARYGEHLALARARWGDAGLTGIDAYGASDMPGIPSRLHAVTLLHFASAEALGAALSGEHFAEVAADIPNFTNVQPILQIVAKL